MASTMLLIQSVVTETCFWPSRSSQYTMTGDRLVKKKKKKKGGGNPMQYVRVILYAMRRALNYDLGFLGPG